METNDGNIVSEVRLGECSVMMKVVEENATLKEHCEDGEGEKADDGCCRHRFNKRLKNLPQEILTFCSKCFTEAFSLGVRAIKTTFVWFLYSLLMILCFLADISR